MIVNTPITDFHTNTRGVLGAVVRLPYNNKLFGLTCFHVIEPERSMRKAIKLQNSSMHVGVSTDYFSEPLDYALIELSEDYIENLKRSHFRLACVLGQITYGTPVKREANGTQYCGKIRDTQNSFVIIDPLSGSFCSPSLRNPGHSGSIWFIQDGQTSPVKAVAMHTQSTEGQSFSGVNLGAVKYELNFEFCFIQNNYNTLA